MARPTQTTFARFPSGFFDKRRNGRSFAGMTTPEAAVRARRKLTNRIIASHDAARLRPFVDAHVTMITGDGALILGAEAVIQAFASQFADPDFITYLRETERVEIDQDGARAAEHGRWTGTWKGSSLTGTYLAAWKKNLGQWVIEAELYVSLA